MKKVVLSLCCGLALCGASSALLAQEEPQVAPDAQKLSAELQNLRQVAGYAPLSGAGVRIELSDGKRVSKQVTPFITGIVHDFDVLGTINELRFLGARGIAVNGIRVTGATSIRCQGPTILVDGKAVSHPYTVEAIGDAAKIRQAVATKHGFVDVMRSTGIKVKFTPVANLTLPAAPLEK